MIIKLLIKYLDIYILWHSMKIYYFNLRYIILGKPHNVIHLHKELQIDQNAILPFDQKNMNLQRRLIKIKFSNV